jgi:hypothetical protein
MKELPVKRTIGALGAIAVMFSVAAAVPAEAAAPRTAGMPSALASGAGAATAVSKPKPEPFSMKQKWAREFTRYGDADTSVYNIAHVRELQYRLTWAGTFNAGVTGTFGTLTRAAVKAYQKKEGLRVTGLAGHKTWAHLIHDTIRRRGQIPQVCKSDGWHACYDRYAHQVTLWHDGEMRNSWLVRGGDYSVATRLGTKQVYLRDIDHVSRLFDAPMPYSQFFDGGQALHGSAYMIDPFIEHSHGCVNFYIEDAKQLWKITSNKKMYVTVYGAWD